jgi:hypothetical protein
MFTNAKLIIGLGGYRPDTGRCNIIIGAGPGHLVRSDPLTFDSIKLL